MIISYMNQKNGLAVSLLAIVAVTGIYFLAEKTISNPQFNGSASSTSVSISQSEWKTYENTAYHYSVKYPQSWHVGQVLEEDRKTVEESRMVEIFSSSPGGKGYIGITTWNPSEFTGTDQASAEFRQSITVDLRSFAEAARQKEMGDKGHILPDKKVGELQEVVFANQKAFSYVVTGSYNKYGGDSADYLFLENKDIKFMIYYSLNNSLPQEIADTFEFTNGSTTAPTGN